MKNTIIYFAIIILSLVFTSCTRDTLENEDQEIHQKIDKDEIKDIDA